MGFIHTRMTIMMDRAKMPRTQSNAPRVLQLVIFAHFASLHEKTCYLQALTDKAN